MLIITCDFILTMTCLNYYKHLIKREPQREKNEDFFCNSLISSYIALTPLLWEQGVVGSNPVAPTKRNKPLGIKHLAQISSGSFYAHIPEFLTNSTIQKCPFLSTFVPKS